MTAGSSMLEKILSCPPQRAHWSISTLNTLAMPENCEAPQKTGGQSSLSRMEIPKNLQ